MRSLATVLFALLMIAFGRPLESFVGRSVCACSTKVACGCQMDAGGGGMSCCATEAAGSSCCSGGAETGATAGNAERLVVSSRCSCQGQPLDFEDSIEFDGVLPAAVAGIQPDEARFVAGTMITIPPSHRSGPDPPPPRVVRSRAVNQIPSLARRGAMVLPPARG